MRVVVDFLAIVLVWWLYVHNGARLFGLPMMNLWKKIGLKVYILDVAIMVVSMFLVYELRGVLFSVSAFTPGTLIGSAGVAVLVSALALWLYSIKTLGFRVTVAASEINDEYFKLVKTGPYSVVRNPIYLAEWLMGVGIFLMSGYAVFLVFIVIWVPLIQIVIHYEELTMKARFGREFSEYAKSVPSLVPRVRSMK